MVSNRRSRGTAGGTGHPAQLLRWWRFAGVMAALVGPGCASGPGLHLGLIDSSVQRPSNVAVYFSVETREGDPVAGLTTESFKIYEDGKLISVHESKQTILNPEIAARHVTVLLVDMSGSVRESEDVPTIIAAARSFAARVGKSQEVAIYAFDGRPGLMQVVPFTSDPMRLEQGLGHLEDLASGDPSTNLNGGVVNALNILDQRLARAREPMRFGTLVVFTDGSDRAARVPPEKLNAALEHSPHDIFVIGVGTEIDENELQNIGRTGMVLAGGRADIGTAFDQAAQRIENMTRRYYLLGYCSPARAGVHEVRIDASWEGRSGSLSYEFNAKGFGPNCDPTRPPSFDVRRPRPPGERRERGWRIRVSAEASAGTS